VDGKDGDVPPRRRPIDEIAYKLVRPQQKRFWQLRYIDPETGNLVQHSTERTDRRGAERVAARFIDALVGGILNREYGWPQFRQRYEREHVNSLAAKSREGWKTAANTFQSMMNPQSVQEITSTMISQFATRLRESGRSAETTKTYLTRIRAALRWAASVDLIRDDQIPKFRMPKRAKGASKLARSRPIVGEELDRLLAAAVKVRPASADAWRRFLRGLWHSSLRLEELLDLSWDAGESLWLDIHEGMPFIRILAEGEKAHQDRVQPITPEFWALCCETHESERHGRVFPLPARKGPQMTPKAAGRVISAIGRKANVRTDPSTGKCATSHDIGRRAFATRMGDVLTLAQLQDWMRHESPQTTANYYHLPTAMQLAARVWARHLGDPLGDPTPMGGDGLADADQRK